MNIIVIELSINVFGYIDGLLGLGVLGGAAALGGVLAVGAVTLAGIGVAKVLRK